MDGDQAGYRSAIRTLNIAMKILKPGKSLEGLILLLVVIFPEIFFDTGFGIARFKTFMIASLIRIIIRMSICQVTSNRKLAKNIVHKKLTCMLPN